MKKIVNGLVYNTETAKEIVSWSNNLSGGDFNHCRESLYRTKNGRWFLCGSGGPMSKYSVSCGSNSCCGGSDIEVITEVEAQEWLENKDEIAALEQYFIAKLQEA